jgi:pyruvate formate lyase activating enzyme
MTEQNSTLANALAQLAAPGELFEKPGDGRVRCFACAHRCLIPDGCDGVCKVRFNRGGVLFAPRGYVAGAHADPIEKKPFFHALPGSVAMSFGMLGCDFHCAYCQNWITSQALRDPQSVAPVTRVTAERFAAVAAESGAASVCSTYNEPLISGEWAVEIFKAARALGLRTCFVSNGHATEEALDYLQPWLDWCKVDLKTFSAENYRQLGGKLDAVLRTIEGLWRRKIWVEVVTLVVPGFNDSDAELTGIAKFIAGISPDIPWHVTAFHPDYKMDDRSATSARQLLRACDLGVAAGLHYVYAGNLPGATREWENTRCPSCRETLIERRGFTVLRNRVADGKCPKCAAPIAGRWS